MTACKTVLIARGDDSHLQLLSICLLGDASNGPSRFLQVFTEFKAVQFLCLLGHLHGRQGLSESQSLRHKSRVLCQHKEHTLLSIATKQPFPEGATNLQPH
jgi:hypothetical protein